MSTDPDNLEAIAKGGIIRIIPDLGPERVMRVSHVEHHIITLADLPEGEDPEDPQMTPREAAALAEAMRDTRGAVADLLRHGRWADSAAAAAGAEYVTTAEVAQIWATVPTGLPSEQRLRYGPALLDSTIREALRIAVTAAENDRQAERFEAALAAMDHEEA